MDVSSILKSLLSSSNVSAISKAAGETKKDVSSVLSSALPMLAGNSSNVSSSLISSLLVGSDNSNILTSLLGGGAAQTVAQESGVSQSSTNNILGTVAPLLLNLVSADASGSSLNASSISSMVSGLFGGAEEEKPAAQTQTASSGKKQSGILSFLMGLFGGKD